MEARLAGAQSIGPVARSVAVEPEVHGGARTSGRRRRPSSRENGPEPFAIDFKQKLYGQRLDELPSCRPTSIIARVKLCVGASR